MSDEIRRISLSDLKTDMDQNPKVEAISALYTDESGKTVELYFYKSVVSADDDELILYSGVLCE
jgi:hypothetical protein